MSSELILTALRIESPYEVPVVPAQRWRAWMNATPGRSANRCLPLLMANQSGWFLLNPDGFSATWDGGNGPGAIALEWDRLREHDAKPVSSVFGSGVLSWSIPYLFRTPPGWNLLARGPANWPRDGATALDGLIETDWAIATFTMNWKLTRPDLTVRFETGDPFCMIVPQRRGQLEAFDTAVAPLGDHPELFERTRAWSLNRQKVEIRRFLIENGTDFSEEWEHWDLEYFRGRRPGDGETVVAPGHQTTLRLASFDSPESDS